MMSPDERDPTGEPLRYVLLNKPRGFLTAKRRDPMQVELPTVIDLLSSNGLRDAMGVSPVGRLDVQSEGLLLLTNDGKLAHRLIHPDWLCHKTYLAITRGHERGTSWDGTRVKFNRPRCSQDICSRLVNEGILLRADSARPYMAKPVAMELLAYSQAEAALGGGSALRLCLNDLIGALPTGKGDADAGTAAKAAAEEAGLDFVTVVLTEGKNHEVRLLLRAVGLSTMRLIRIAHGPLVDAALQPPGAWRELQSEELTQLLEYSLQKRVKVQAAD